MKSEKPKTLAQLARTIYDSEYGDLTPLQQEELKAHIKAEKRIKNLTTGDKIELLIYGFTNLNVRIKTKKEKHT